MNISVVAAVPHNKRATIIERGADGSEIRTIELVPGEQKMIFIVDGNSISVMEACLEQ